MKTIELIKAAQKPEIYTQGTAVMWVDEYISTQLLETHLNPDIELASRKKLLSLQPWNGYRTKCPVTD